MQLLIELTVSAGIPLAKEMEGNEREVSPSRWHAEPTEIGVIDRQLLELKR